jgi:hypothetical protein
VADQDKDQLGAVLLVELLEADAQVNQISKSSYE